MVPIAVVLSLGCLVSAVLGGTSVSIEGGGRVEVGDNVNIICLCTGDSQCYSYGVVFRISGRDYTHSQLLDGSVPQYSIGHGAATYPNVKVILILTQATLDNDGTTYECKIFPDNWDQANTVTLSVIDHVSVQNSSQTTVATNIMVTTTTSTRQGNGIASSVNLFSMGTSPDILHRTRIPPLQNAVTFTTTTTTTVTTTATPRTPVISVPSTGTEVESSSIQVVPSATLTPFSTPATQATAHNTGGHATANLEYNMLHSRGFPPLQSAIMSTATTTTTTTAKTTIKLEQTHVIENNPLGYIVVGADIISSTGFSPLQSVMSTKMTTTTTTTTTTATMTTTTATPPTPVTSALSTETEGPTLKTTSEKTTEPVKEDDAPTYVYVAVGSGVGIVVYILTIVLIGLVILLKIKAKKAARRGSGMSPSMDNERENEYPVSIPMVSNPVYSEVVSPSGPAPPYFKVDPYQFGDRQIVVHMDTRYHDVPQRKSVAAESLYDYIDTQ